MVYLIIGVVAGVICAIIAASKGRNAVGWFFIGFFFGLIGIIIIAVVSNVKEERARYQRSLDERRRLREELKIERLKSQQFRGSAAQRLDIHDRALGVDTKAGTSRGALGAGPAGRVGPPPPAPAGSNSPRWYFSSGDGSQQGPVTLGRLAAEFRGGTFTPTDLVWREGWKDWRRAADVPGFIEKLRG